MFDELREQFNKLDLESIDNDNHFYDLVSLYESTQMSSEDKEEIKKVMNATNDSETIAAVIAAKMKKNESYEDSYMLNHDYISYNDFIADSFDGYNGEDIDALMKTLRKYAKALHTRDYKMVCEILDNDYQYDYSPRYVYSSSYENITENARVYHVDGIDVIDEENYGVSYLWFASEDDANKYWNNFNPEQELNEDVNHYDELFIRDAKAYADDPSVGFKWSNEYLKEIEDFIENVVGLDQLLDWDGVKELKFNTINEAFDSSTVSNFEAVLEAAKNVMIAYQNANKWLDSVKEFVYTDLSCPFFSSFIHSLAHTMPGRFDKFGDILHTVNVKVPYPATVELNDPLFSIEDAFVIIFEVLDSIKAALNEFIKVTDDEEHGMACAAEALLNDIESEYPILYRLRDKWNQSGDLVEFDKYVQQYVDAKDNLLENLNNRYSLSNETASARLNESLDDDPDYTPDYHEKDFRHYKIIFDIDDSEDLEWECVARNDNEAMHKFDEYASQKNLNAFNIYVKLNEDVNFVNNRKNSFIRSDDDFGYAEYDEEYNSNNTVDQLIERLTDAIKDYLNNKGFEPEEINDIIRNVDYIDATNDDNYYEIRVALELDYDKLVAIADKLDIIIQEYDPAAYFDVEDVGLLSAYLSKEYFNVNESLDEDLFKTLSDAQKDIVREINSHREKLSKEEWESEDDDNLAPPPSEEDIKNFKIRRYGFSW